MATKKSPVSWGPVSPTGTGRSRRWLVDGKRVTVDQWKELYDYVESLDSVSEQTDLLAQYDISPPTLRKYAGVAPLPKKKAESKSSSSSPKSVEDLLAEIDSEIERYTDMILDLKAKRKALETVDADTIKLITELMGRN